MIEPYLSHIRPLLTFASPIWNIGYVGDMRKLESVQRRWTKEIAGLTNLDYSSRLHSLQLFSMKGRLLRDDLVLCWKILHLKTHVRPHEIFQFSPVPTRGHRLKIFKPQINSELRKRFFSYRIIAEWNSLPADAIEATTITEFKSRIHSFLGNRLYDYYE